MGLIRKSSIPEKSRGPVDLRFCGNTLLGKSVCGGGGYYGGTRVFFDKMAGRM